MSSAKWQSECPGPQYALFALDCFVLLILKILRFSSQIFFNCRGFSTGYGTIVCLFRKILFVHILSSLSPYSEILWTLAKRPHITRLCSNFLSVFQDHVRSHGVSNHGWISFVKRYQSGPKKSIIAALVKGTLMHCSLRNMEVNKAGFHDASCRLAPSNSQTIWTHKVHYWPSTVHW